MKERPIIFSGDMGKAILDGRKTMTRRAVKPQPIIGVGGYLDWRDMSLDALMMANYCPYGVPGDRLWVKEQWIPELPGDYMYDAEGFPPGQWPAYLQTQAILHYRATSTLGDGWKWRSPRFMPRWASRITLEVVSVKVERLQDISIHDALCEGVRCRDCGYTSVDAGLHMDHALCVNKWLAESKTSDSGDHGAIDAFRELWDSISAKKPGCSWESNPWVWAIEFRR